MRAALHQCPPSGGEEGGVRRRFGRTFYRHL